MSFRNQVRSFIGSEDGAFTADWAMQAATVLFVGVMVLSSVDQGDRVSSRGDTHYNGFTITSQYP
ncbi:hypothetical protein [Palleronia abyssalis]|uniref:Uncharacterized protein n=1 Tax=Palleronia abyssalis TaxID=1501240 RepID=A0A2R8BX68_9RHOB|nr:hypothetical protein [Palleronia abyssalis]SPJ24767.1 hypothetical protein PAA8504_02605 [Palleronia abyssalis]